MSLRNDPRLLLSVIVNCLIDNIEDDFDQNPEDADSTVRHALDLIEQLREAGEIDKDAHRYATNRIGNAAHRLNIEFDPPDLA